MAPSTPTLYVFHCNPAARAALMTAKYLGLKCNLKEIDMVKEEHKSPEFRKINSECSIPTLDDEGFILSDSHAILPYLVAKYGTEDNDSLYPSSDLRRRAVIDQRLHFENGVLFPRVVAIGRKDQILTNTLQPIKEDLEKLHEAYDFLEAFLEKGLFVVGDSLSVADFSIFPSVITANLFVERDVKKWPKITAWVERMEKLPCSSANDEGMKKLKGFLAK